MSFFRQDPRKQAYKEMVQAVKAAKKCLDVLNVDHRKPEWQSMLKDIAMSELGKEFPVLQGRSTAGFLEDYDKETIAIMQHFNQAIKTGNKKDAKLLTERLERTEEKK